MHNLQLHVIIINMHVVIDHSDVCMCSYYYNY